MKSKRYFDIVPARGLLHGETGYSFECPHCGKVWDIPEGGRKVGFTKAAAQVHLSACYDAALFLKGYVKKSYFPGPGQGNSPLAVPISRLDGSEPWHARTLRLLKAGVRRLEKAKEDNGVALRSISNWGKLPLFAAKVGTTASNLIMVKRARRFYVGQSIEFATISEVEGMSTGCTPPWRGGRIWKMDGQRLFVERW